MAKTPRPASEMEDSAWDIYSEVELIDAENALLDRVKYQTSMLIVFREIVKQLSDDRREDVRTLNHEHGMSYKTLAKELQMTPGRVQQLVTGVGSPKRPGVIEVETKLQVARMSEKGMSPAEIVREIVPTIRGHRGGAHFSAQKIAEILDVSPDLVEAEMAAMQLGA